MIFVALCMVILFGIAAWVIDGSALYQTRRSLQNAADAAALASVVELPSIAAVETTAQQYAQDNHPDNGTILHLSDIETGNWDDSSETFTVGGSPLNAVRVTTRRDLAHGNPVDYVFAPVIGKDNGDVTAQAIAVVEPGGDGGVRFLIDDEMIDKDVKDSNDVEVIEELAACAGRVSEDVISDLDGDWFIDLYDSMVECGQGFQIELPTGQGTSPGNQDPGLMEVDAAFFPYGQTTSPYSLEDFLNFNEDGSWRNGVLGPDWADQLDPLLGAAGVWNDADYPSFVSDSVLVSPVYKSDISNLVPGIGAKGERRGLIAFKIIAIGANPPGSDLPWIIIEVVDPDTIDLSNVGLGEPGSGGGAIWLVR